MKLRCINGGEAFSFKNIIFMNEFDETLEYIYMYARICLTQSEMEVITTKKEIFNKLSHFFVSLSLISNVDGL